MSPVRWLPHPLMTLVLIVLWLFLVNEISPGHLVLGAIFGVLIPLFVAPFWVDPVRYKKPMVGVRYCLLVLFDIVVANIQVSRLILFRRPQTLKPQFLVIPLEVTSPYAITILAGTITMTPGTVSSDVDSDRKHLLVHGLDVDDPEEMIANIKRRYEAPLKEIFG